MQLAGPRNPEASTVQHIPTCQRGRENDISTQVPKLSLADTKLVVHSNLTARIFAFLNIYFQKLF
jgi:hypothetical protein